MDLSHVKRAVRQSPLIRSEDSAISAAVTYPEAVVNCQHVSRNSPDRAVRVQQLRNAARQSYESTKYLRPDLRPADRPTPPPPTRRPTSVLAPLATLPTPLLTLAS